MPELKMRAFIRFRVDTQQRKVLIFESEDDATCLPSCWRRRISPPTVEAMDAEVKEFVKVQTMIGSLSQMVL